MKTITALPQLLLLATLVFGPAAGRADEFKLTATPVSTIGVSTDKVATDLMPPYPIYGFSVHSLAFSPDGRTLATGDGNGLLRFWGTAQGELQSTVAAHQGWVFSIAWLADGRRLATGGKDRLVRLREAAHPERILKTFEGHSNDVHAVALTADDATLVSGGDDRTLRMWDVKTGNESGVLRGHTADVLSVKFSPDGKVLASASYDRTIRLWDLKTLLPTTVLTGHTYRVVNVAFAPDGKQLASAGDHTARLWDIQTGANVETFVLESKSPPGQQRLSGAVSAVAYSPDGQMLAIASTLGTVHLVSPASGTILHTLTPPPGPTPATPLR